MKNLLFIFIAIASSNVVAQPILTSSNFVFNYPDSVSYFVADSSSVIDVIVGPNVVFNYKNIKGYGVIQKGYYVDPATTTSSSSFPTANLAEKSDASAQNYIYTKNTVDSVTNLGFVANVVGFGLTTAKYDINPEITMKFPFGYGNSYSDSYSGTFSAVISGFTVSTNAAGTVNVVADAWGRLDFPNTLSIDSVIRVERIENMVTDPIVIPLSPTIPAITVFAKVTSYYKPSISKAPILSFVEGSYNQSGSIIQSSKTCVSQFPIGFVSVEEINSFKSVELYPNPTSSNSTIVLDVDKPSHVKIELLNVLGETALQVVDLKLSVGKNKFEINTSNLKSGVYFVSITTGGNNTSLRKLIIQ